MTTRLEHASRPGRESLSKKLGRTHGRILARDGWCCVYCAATVETSGAPLQLDHLTCRSAGGLDVATNLVAACRSCNSRRGAIRLSVWCDSLGLSSATIRRQARRAIPAV
jgi:5-methylcytosine-specific restriction endonuclease McrA